MSSDTPQDRFKDNAVKFSELIGDVIARAHQVFVAITTTTVLLDIAKLGLANAPADTLIEIFIKKSYAHWEKLKMRDVQFFLKEGLIIFEGLPEQNVADFNRLFVAKIYTPLSADVTMSVELYKAIEKSGVFNQKRDEVTLDRSGVVTKFRVEPLVDDALMSQVWTFFQASAKQSVSYIHFRRSPDLITKKYRQPYFAEISVKKATELWELKEYR